MARKSATPLTASRQKAEEKESENTKAVDGEKENQDEEKKSEDEASDDDGEQAVDDDAEENDGDDDDGDKDATAKAVAAETARVIGIMASPEAKGREEHARLLAEMPGLSVEKAEAFLKAGGKSAVVGLNAAMTSLGNADIGADSVAAGKGPSLADNMRSRFSRN